MYYLLHADGVPKDISSSVHHLYYSGSRYRRGVIWQIGECTKPSLILETCSMSSVLYVSSKPQYILRKTQNLVPDPVASTIPGTCDRWAALYASASVSPISLKLPARSSPLLLDVRPHSTWRSCFEDPANAKSPSVEQKTFR